MRNKFIFFLFIAQSLHVRADLRPIYLDIKLSADRTHFSNEEILPFWIEFTNTSTKTYPFILPSNNPSKKKIIFFSFFTVDENDCYTEVYRESEVIEMDTSIQAWNNVRNLKPNESTKFPLYFNDQKNYNSHIEAHHQWNNIPDGEYQVLAWYQPWRDDYTKLLYNPIDPFGHDVAEETQPYKFDMPTDGLQSNYISITIQNGFLNSPFLFENTESCPENCWYCRAIEDGKWSKVEKIIDVQTYYKGKRAQSHVDTTWCQTHRNVAWLGPKPQAILMSLPTWTSRNVIFKNADGYHYYTLRWQLGIIYPGRSRFGSAFYWMGFRRPPFETSEVDYCKLVDFIGD